MKKLWYGKKRWLGGTPLQGLKKIIIKNPLKYKIKYLKNTGVSNNFWHYLPKTEVQNKFVKFLNLKIINNMKNMRELSEKYNVARISGKFQKHF